MKKKLLKIAGLAICIALLLSCAWFGWQHVKYSRYTDGMELLVLEDYSEYVPDVFYRLVPRYVYKDAEGFDFSVKYPGLMSLTGNLAVGMPGTEEDPFTDGLIIWPELTGGYTFGVLLNNRDGGDGWQIYVDENGDAVDPEMQGVVDEYRETVDLLMEKAFDFWAIK